MGVISSNFPFTSSTSCTVLQKYTNFSKHNNLKTPYFQCRWLKSNPHPLLIPHCINHPSIPNSSRLLAFLFISPSVYLTPILCLSLSLFLSLIHRHTHTHNALTHSYKYTLFLSHPHPLHPSLLAGSLKTSLSREEGKVLFCLISLQSPTWRKHS